MLNYPEPLDLAGRHSIDARFFDRIGRNKVLAIEAECGLSAGGDEPYCGARHIANLQAATVKTIASMVDQKFNPAAMTNPAAAAKVQAIAGIRIKNV
jgi:hypothetical protein